MKNNVKTLFRLKTSTRLISLILTLLILFFAVPSVVYAETAEALKSSDNAEALLSEGEDSTVSETKIYEAEELREENAKHFILADGSYA